MNLLKKVIPFVLALIVGLPSFGTNCNSALMRLKGDTNTILQRSISSKSIRNTSLKAELSNVESTYAYTWGTIDHENGYTWYYTQTFEERGWYLGASDITIYDNNFEQVCTLHIDIPEDMNVNDVMPVDFISSQFFNTDANSYELPVFVHAVDNGTQINKVYVYNFDGEIVQEYNSRSMLMFTASDNYKRVLLVNEENGLLTINILKAAQDNNLPVIEHTFTIDQDLLYYNNGPALNYYTLAGKPFYCISHFEKPCMDGYDMESFIPTQTPDNYLLIKTYDEKYEMVDSLRISIASSNSDATYGFASLGMMSNEDVRLGEFTNDNQRNYIVTHYDYYALSDDFIYNFRVYDQKGNLVNTIAENTTTWFGLSDIKGCEEQIVFLKTNDSGEQLLEMIDIPSCNIAATFPAMVDGYQISTTLDRYPVDDEYQYVIGLSQATPNKDGDAIARIGWYKRDCTVDHYVEFNLGKNAEGFTPYIAGYVLNPYLFNTDDKREYFYLAMNKRTDGSDVLDKTLYLADEDGKVLRTIKPEAGDEIEFSSGDVFDYNTDSPCMLLSFYNGDKDAFEIQYYSLPFDKFTNGGDGTVDSPYVITNPGELAQMHSEPAAHYVLGNDIDMSSYAAPYYGATEFTGTFDGNNYVISNIVLNNGGLFTTTNGATIKNVQLQSPIFNVGDTDCGIVVNTANNTTIENVHIYDAVVEGNGSDDKYVGGMVGVADNTSIQVASMIRALVSSDLTNFGGVAGCLNNSVVTASVTSGEFDVAYKSGGIASYVSYDSRIANSHTQWTVLLPSYFGEIAAQMIGVVRNCYTAGTIYGELDELNYPYHDYAGIAYMQDSNPDVNTVSVIENCVSLNNKIVADYKSGMLCNNYSQNMSGDDASSVYGMYKAQTDMNRAFFEELGYKYGNTVDAPWVGEGLPLLYFENERQSVTVVNKEDGNIQYDGTLVSVANAEYVALFNMQGQLVATTRGNMLNVADVATGVYVVVAVDNNGNNQVRKIVVR